MPLAWRNGHLLWRNGHLAWAPDCCCAPSVTPGDDCPTHCAAGTTPQAYDVTFAAIANSVCGSSAYYNATFRFLQNGTTPCVFDIQNGSPPDVWAGPCSIGPTHLTLGSTVATIDITDTGGVFLTASKSAGGDCMGTLSFTFSSSTGAPMGSKQLNWSAATATAVAVNP